MSDKITAALQTHPELGIARDVFLAYLARTGADVDALDAEALAELCLACGCSAGNDEALRLFEARYLSGVGAALAHMRLSPDAVDEVRQRVRQKLLVADGDHPKLDAYAGRGRLRGLIQVVAVREAISLLRKDKPLGSDASLAALPSHDLDPELRYLKAHYRAAFSSAFERAVRALTSRERNFLRLQAHAGLTVEQIATMYGVHRATATRWLTKIREQLLRDTRKGLATDLEISAAELESVMKLIGDNLDISVHRILETIGDHG